MDIITNDLFLLQENIKLESEVVLPWCKQLPTPVHTVKFLVWSTKVVAKITIFCSGSNQNIIQPQANLDQVMWEITESNLK